MPVKWNPWHGCQKISEGCRNCYVYRIDGYHGKDSSLVYKTKDFYLPARRTRNRSYKITPGETVYACFTSDFLLEEADAWRAQAWEMMKMRSDLSFFIITKRIDRLKKVLPPNWGGGYDNVAIACTAENQQAADYRLPIYKAAPIKHKEIICAPLLGPIDLGAHLGDWVKAVTVGGESGKIARVCDYNWVLDIRKQCVEKKIPFSFHQTGTYLLKDGKKYTIAKKMEHAQAKKAGINYK